MRIWGQIISLIAMLAIILSFQCKSNRRLVEVIGTGALLFAISYFLLGQPAGELRHQFGQQPSSPHGTFDGQRKRDLLLTHHPTHQLIDRTEHQHLLVGLPSSTKQRLEITSTNPQTTPCYCHQHRPYQPPAHRPSA